MPYFVYLVKCSDDSLYCGYTNDLEKRVLDHNSGKTGAKYTKTRRPVTLVYSQKTETKSEAMKLEYSIKKLTRKEKLKLVENK